MALDPCALLSQIETAIEALLTGGHSSYAIGGRQVTKLDLAQLMEERRMLLNEVQRSESRSVVRLAKFGRVRR